MADKVAKDARARWREREAVRIFDDGLSRGGKAIDCEKLSTS